MYAYGGESGAYENGEGNFDDVLKYYGIGTNYNSEDEASKKEQENNPLTEGGESSSNKNEQDPKPGKAVKKSKHDIELEKYGYLIGGFNVTGTLSLGYGGTIEYGSVQTSKNYVQQYYTIYYTSTAAAGVGLNGFFIVNKGNKKTTFSDFAGGTFGGSVNYGEVSGTYGTSKTYNSYGGGVGFGLSFKLFGSGSVGHTTLIGVPMLSKPTNIKDWRPISYELGL